MAKVLLPNQCTLLHMIYGYDNCCLCQAHKRIRELEEEISRLKERISESIPVLEET